MAFFSRPILDNIQFKQLPDSILNLSGQTRIVDISGLTLANGSGSNIIITARNPVVGNIMTFDGTEIRLMPPNPSGSTGNSGNYFGNSPTTCTVGGLSGGTAIYGRTIENILQSILVPLLNPSISAPYNTFTIPLLNPYEVGCVLNSLTGSTTFNMGSVSPVYCGGPSTRTGAATCYMYTDFYNSGHTCSLSSFAIAPYTVLPALRMAYGCVCYSAGQYPLNSSGGTTCSCCSVGYTISTPVTICGIYPYFYGKVASGGCPAGVNRPTPTCALVIAGTKAVSDSSSTLYINFNSASDDYIWFAIPSGSTKTCWCVNALNNGAIGGAVSAGGNLFPTRNCVSVTCGLWVSVGGSPHAYNVYISNYQTAANTLMTLS